MARHVGRPGFRCATVAPAQAKTGWRNPRAAPKNRDPALLGSAPPGPLLRLHARLRRLLSCRAETVAARRRAVSSLQDSVLHFLRLRATHLRGGHYQGIRAAPQSHSGLCITVPARKRRAEGQSVSSHRPPGGRNEPTGPALWSDDRGAVWRAVSNQGVDTGRRCGGYAGTLNLIRILALERLAPPGTR